jgi:hypothetical protein
MLAWRWGQTDTGAIMAGLSIERRRKAWLAGVASGATGKNWSRLELPKLMEIYNRGVAYGRAHLDAPFVKAAVEQQKVRLRGAQRPAAGRPTRPIGRFAGRRNG